MNNIEKNALRIAELIGLPTNKSNTMVFEQYNGLMPIVFECICDARTLCEIRISSIVKLRRNINWLDGENFTFTYDTEPEFIEAIQQAVIKYLELKNVQ